MRINTNPPIPILPNGILTERFTVDRFAQLYPLLIIVILFRYKHNEDLLSHCHLNLGIL